VGESREEKIKIGPFPPSPSSPAMKNQSAAIVSAVHRRLREAGGFHPALPKAPPQERAARALPSSLRTPCSGEGAGGSGAASEAPSGCQLSSPVGTRRSSSEFSHRLRERQKKAAYRAVTLLRACPEAACMPRAQLGDASGDHHGLAGGELRANISAGRSWLSAVRRSGTASLLHLHPGNSSQSLRNGDVTSPGSLEVTPVL